MVKIDDIISFSSYLELEYYHSFMKENRLLDEMGIYLQYDSVKLHFLIKHIENGFNIQRLINSRENEKNLNLTARKQELVTYLEKGIKNKEIANILYISEHTVKKYLQNLYRKFNANNRTELLYKIRKK